MMDVWGGITPGSFQVKEKWLPLGFGRFSKKDLKEINRKIQHKGDPEVVFL